MGLPSGTAPRSLPKPSPNIYGRDMAATLTHVGTTVSVLITPLVDMMVPLVEFPNKPQSTPPRPLLCGLYPPLINFSPPLSGYVPHSSCGLVGGSDPFLRQSA